MGWSDASGAQTIYYRFVLTALVVDANRNDKQRKVARPVVVKSIGSLDEAFVGRPLKKNGETFLLSDTVFSLLIGAALDGFGQFYRGF